jgi:hypothetical protein
MNAFLFTAIHNQRIHTEIENKLNSLIDEIIASGGKVWIQAKSNKEHYYMLTEEISLYSYQPIKIDKEI